MAAVAYLTYSTRSICSDGPENEIASRTHPVITLTMIGILSCHLRQWITLRRRQILFKVLKLFDTKDAEMDDRMSGYHMGDYETPDLAPRLCIARSDFQVQVRIQPPGRDSSRLHSKEQDNRELRGLYLRAENYPKQSSYYECQTHTTVT